jgi:hypothetical protein
LDKKQAVIVSIVLAAVAAGLGLGWKYRGKVVPKLGLWDSEEAIT